MAMNIGDMASSVRLQVRGKAVPAARLAAVREFFRKNGIRTVLLSADAMKDGGASIARKLNDEFKVIVECGSTTYRALLKEPAENMKNIALQPVFDISDSAAELKKLVGLLPARNGTASLHIRNAGMIIDRERTAKAFNSLKKIVGQKNVKFTWDCGFVFCAFSEEDEDTLGYFIQKGSDIGFTCPSIVHVDTQLNVSLCDRLKGPAETRRATADTMMSDVANQFLVALMPFQSFGIRAACGTCRYFKNTCVGGCRAEVMKSFQ